jgi:hypothetical protein
MWNFHRHFIALSRNDHDLAANLFATLPWGRPVRQKIMEHRSEECGLVNVPVQLRFELGRTRIGVVRSISRSGMYVETLAKAMPALGIGQPIRCSSEGRCDAPGHPRIGIFLLLLLALAAASGAGQAQGPGSANAPLPQEPWVDARVHRGMLGQSPLGDLYHHVTVREPILRPPLRGPGVDAVCPFHWLYQRWHALADWTAGQPVYIRLVIGSSILALAYLLFVTTLSGLLGRRDIVFAGQRRRGSGALNGQPDPRPPHLGTKTQRASCPWQLCPEEGHRTGSLGIAIQSVADELTGSFGTTDEGGVLVVAV